MSWTDKIENLKEKFWRAETTLEEESLLRNHSLNTDESDIESLYFQFLEEERSVSYRAVKRNGVVPMFRKNITAIAAGLALVFASILVFNQIEHRGDSKVFIADSPEEALLITQTAFGLINDHITTGDQMVKTNLNQFDKINSLIKIYKS